MNQKLDAVDVLEKSGCAALRAGLERLVRFDFAEFVFAKQTRQIRDLPAIDGRRRKTEFLFEGLFQRGVVWVLAEDHRNYDPMVSRPHLAVGAQVARKSALLEV